MSGAHLSIITPWELLKYDNSPRWRVKAARFTFHFDGLMQPFSLALFDLAPSLSIPRLGGTMKNGNFLIASYFRKLEVVEAL